jgi:hypothetical protein
VGKGADQRSHARIVGGCHQGGLLPACRVQQQVHGIGGGVSQTGRRLIGQNHARLKQHGTCKWHTLRLATRELRRSALRQVSHTQGLPCAPDAGCIFGVAAGPLRQSQVLLHRQRRAPMQLLRQKAYGGSAPGIGRHFLPHAQWRICHRQAAGPWSHQGRNPRQLGGLATAGGPVKQQDSALLHTHIGECKQQTLRVSAPESGALNHAQQLNRRV